MKKHFPHRLNADGSYDSICKECFRTVATEEEEDKLRDRELQHVCEARDILSLTKVASVTFWLSS
jgi:hypothetical protein